MLTAKELECVPEVVVSPLSIVDFDKLEVDCLNEVYFTESFNYLTI